MMWAVVLWTAFWICVSFRFVLRPKNCVTIKPQLPCPRGFDSSFSQTKLSREDKEERKPLDQGKWGMA